MSPQGTRAVSDRRHATQAHERVAVVDKWLGSQWQDLATDFRYRRLE